MTVKKRRDGARGFTLIELMVGVAMLAVVVGIAVPNMYQLVVNVKTKSAAREVYEMLQHARILAAKEGCDVWVNFGDPETYGTAFSSVSLVVDVDNDGKLDSTDTDGNPLDSVRMTYDFVSPLKAERKDPAKRAVVFNPIGAIRSGSGGWAVGNEINQRTYTLEVSILGNVKMTGSAG